MFEVLIRIPGVLGSLAVVACCIMEGSKMQSDIILVEIKFGAKQVIFMRKSVVEV